jgi:hypothetical protein
MDIEHALRHALAHPGDIDDLPSLLNNALAEIMILRGPMTVHPNPNVRPVERGTDGGTYNKQRAGNAAMQLDSNSERAKSPGLSNDDPL